MSGQVVMLRVIFMFKHEAEVQESANNHPLSWYMMLLCV